MNFQKYALSFGVEIPFVVHLGFELKQFEDGLSQIDFEPKPEHLNSFHVVHGGASMTLLDVTMAVAARSAAQDMGVVTIEMKTSFMQAARGRLMSKGRLIHRTKTMAFTEASIFDSEGKICAHATGTFKYVERLVTGTETSHPLNTISTD
jgi:uncharacterized protein (TIGR00369 family)